MIKKGVLFSLMLLFSWSYSQINWMNFDDAIKANQIKPKKIVLFFNADYCSNCKKMEQTTFKTPEIYNYINEHYYAVKLNVESTKEIKYKGRKFDYNEKSKVHDFATYMNVNQTPSIVLLDSKANPLTILQGRLSAIELDPYLQFFGSDKYLKVKTRNEWVNYLRKFKSKIKK